MRILIKGGVWKNSEDEILKAAVMKYGKNQWARVASLLNRKSSKQCKARWYEWLDPSVKKIEWNRDEEEKLLHLAKIMPNQWRTIAPIVGRTAAQCIEHYERLLDEANEEEGLDRTEDPRKLRPGEIDPTPETKPARPDPIDMDADELEMLSEARARLANTQGKKEKRKARERQLEESRCMAMLQKRRELKAAGIESKLGSTKRKRGIDYATEIPFQRAVPAGFYDVSEENSALHSVKLDPKAHVIELAQNEKQREQDEEEKRRKQDAKRLKSMLKDHAPAVISKMNELNDPTTLRTRSALRLPEPQVSDIELEEIVKNGQLLQMAPPVGLPMKNSLGAQGNGAGLPGQTPMRTPRREDVIMTEARNQKAMRSIPSVLNAANEDDEAAGYSMPDLHEGTGFAGASPRSHVAQTPNTLLGGGSSQFAGSETSSVRSGRTNASSLALRTPMRDQLGLNDASSYYDMDNLSDMGSLSGSSARSSLRGQQTQFKNSLLSQLKSLPEPEYVIELSVPNIDMNEEEAEDSSRGTAGVIEDAADRAERSAKTRALKEQAELAKRSAVLRRGLPRPSGRLTDSQVETMASLDFGSSSHDNADGVDIHALQRSHQLIIKEMANLMEYDEYKYPVVSAAGNAGPEARPVELDVIPESELKEAMTLIENEILNSGCDRGAIAQEAFQKQWLKVQSEIMFIPNRTSEGCFDIPATKSEHLSALATNFQALKSRAEKDNKKIAKLDSKLSMLTKGYVARSAKLQENLLQSYATLGTLSNDLACSESTFAMEKRMAPLRLEAAQRELATAVTRENLLQSQYAKLMKLIK